MGVTTLAEFLSLHHLNRYNVPDTIFSIRLKLLTIVYYLPIQVRKAILEACRVQVPVNSNAYLSTTFASLDPYYLIGLDDHGIMPYKNRSRESKYGHIQLDELIKQVDLWTVTPFGASILSYMIRAESFYDVTTPDVSISESIKKEFVASQQKNRSSTLLYEGFDPDARNYTELSSCIVAGLRSIHESFHRAILLPTFSSKTVGEETKFYYYQSGGRSECVSTEALLRHYYQTGVRVQGANEIRASWKYNDLKPRTYYAMGGTDYFESQYVKAITNAIVDILPLTNRFLRFDTSRLTETSISDGEVLVTYDYSSFTTSLSELKHFLFRIAESLMDCEVLVLDVYQGLMQTTLGILIGEYNEAINYHARFDLSKACDAMSRSELTEGLAAVSLVYRQSCSGMLGVPGNIGLSTATHGYSVASFSDEPRRGSVVGDDTLYRLPNYEREDFILHTKRLIPSLATDKVSSILKPQDLEDKDWAAFKYLKRPLSLTEQGFIEDGILWEFPNIAALLDIDPDDRTTGFADLHTRARSFFTQLGRFLDKWRLFSRPPLEIVHTALYILEPLYDAIKAPRSGAFNGTVISLGTDSVTVDVMIPPLTDDIGDMDWRSILVDNFQGRYIQLPRYTSTREPPPDISVGQVFQCQDSKLTSLLVGLGVLEREMEIEMVLCDSRTYEYLKDRDSRTYSISYSFTVLPSRSASYDEVPPWYQDVHRRLFYLHEEKDVPDYATTWVSSGWVI